MMRSLRLLAFIASLIAAMSVGASAGELSASLNATSFKEGQNVYLLLEARGGEPKGKLDLSPLEINFEIRSSGQRRFMELLDGDLIKGMRWDIVLRPLHTGTYQVPALRTGSWRSSPIEITVIPQAHVLRVPSGAPTHLDASIEKSDPYLQQQFRYRLRFFQADPTEVYEFGPTQTDTLVWLQAGGDLTYPSIVDGRKYHVIERDYHGFAQFSGAHDIPAPWYKGNRDNGKGNSLRLKVRPPPAALEGTAWLPATDVTIEMNWPEKTPELDLGQPISGRLTIMVNGARNEQIPIIRLEGGAGFKAYYGRLDASELLMGNAIIGFRSQQVTLVPIRVGQVTLPAVRMIWWDVTTGRLRETVMPSRVFTILPGVGKTTFRPVGESPFTISIWVLWIVGAALVAALAFMAIGKFHLPVRLDVLLAYRSGKPDRLKSSLLRWAGRRWPNARPGTLWALSERINSSDMKRFLQQLDQSLYGNGMAPVPGSALSLWVAMSGTAEGPKRQDVNQLPSLYP